MSESPIAASGEASASSSSSTKPRCNGCHTEFVSRNAVFKHLIETNGACLSDDQRNEFWQYYESTQQQLQQKRNKVLLLFGYYCSKNPDASTSPQIPTTISNGDDAARMLVSVLFPNAADGTAPEDEGSRGLQRTYGNMSRGTPIVAQDDNTGALTEVLAVRLAHLSVHTSVSDWINDINRKLDERLCNNEGDRGSRAYGAVVRLLGRWDLPSSASKFNPEMDYSHRRIEYLLPIDFFFFSASSDNGTPSTQPGILGQSTLTGLFAKIFSFSDGSHSTDEDHEDGRTTVPTQQQQHLSRHDESLMGVCRPSRDTLQYMHQLKKVMQSLSTHIEPLNVDDPAAMLEKECSQAKRERKLKYAKMTNNNNKKPKQDNPLGRNGTSNDPTHSLKEIPPADMASSEPQRTSSNSENAASRPDGKRCDRNPKATRKNRGNKGTHVLRRRRFHNFTPTVMAHEFLAFRRLDRFYHRATVRFEPDEATGQLRLLTMNTFSKTDPTQYHSQNGSLRPFLVLSLNGDLFLHGQAPRLVGLFLAIAMGVVDPDIVDCVFDERYPHLVPTPPAPVFAMYAAEAYYVKWEGKLKAILTPRPGEPEKAGWNDSDTLKRVQDWTTLVRERVAQEWIRDGVEESDGRLVSVVRWTDVVLLPWAAAAKEQLSDYRRWKSQHEVSIASEASNANSDAQKSMSSSAESIVDNQTLPLTPVGLASLPALDSIDPIVPEMFAKVLFYLRQVDTSRQWPSTTAKRQLVMISKVKDACGEGGSDPASATSLSVAHMRANSQKSESTQSSAYIFQEGQGGASGSFSVGSMPGGLCAQPKANSLFPELMKAAFELEMALRPNREPSSTIAINRNAQFRPHTDSGAGVGQGTSLIVGLGTYSGGELVVEGERHDIRYKAIEFNGWKQRHWTMPFLGERYSLVWFTPKGCEGVRGIDLC